MAIVHKLSAPLGPQKIESISIRTELDALDAVRILRCQAGEGSASLFDHATLAIDLGARLTGRPVTELQLLSGMDAEVLQEVCSTLAITAYSRSRTIVEDAEGLVCGVKVRAPNLGELAMSEREDGEFEMIAGCCSMSVDELEKRSAAEYLALRRAVYTVKKSEESDLHPTLQALRNALAATDNPVAA